MLPLSNDQAQAQSKQKNGDPLTVLYTISVIHSSCIIVFLRHGFGQQALGMRGLLALVLLLFCLPADPRMVWWLVAFLVAVAIHRIVTSGQREEERWFIRSTTAHPCS